jgi:hypothetical protein
MFALRSPIASLGQRVLGIKRRCIKLIATACDTYRPERHYMRGPGPKWFAKHGVVPIGRYVGARQVRDHWALTLETISSKRSNPLRRRFLGDPGSSVRGEEASAHTWKADIRRRDRVKEKVAVG